MPAEGARSVAVAAGWLVMGLTVALTCGLSLTPRAEAVPSSLQLAGRWAGTIYGIQGDSSRCDNGDCTLTVDLVPCGKSWCGIEVAKTDHACGAVAIRLDAAASPGDGYVEHRGRLELGKGTESFAIQLVLHEASEDVPAQVHLLGNTGPELMLFRRSFPLEASLARLGDATCQMDEKPSS